MARGTLHQPKEQKHGRTPRVHTDTIELSRDDEVRGPELFEVTLRGNWSPYVEAWYDTWRKSPQAQAFEDTDWQTLGRLAFAQEALEKRFSAATMAEIRMTEEKLGATVTDRLRARMKIEDDDAESAPVVELKSVKKDITERMKR